MEESNRAEKQMAVGKKKRVPLSQEWGKPDEFDDKVRGRLPSQSFPALHPSIPRTERGKLPTTACG